MRSILIDTNILLLLIVGMYDKQLIEKHRRTENRFVIEDYDLLTEYIEQYQTWGVTSHSLAEVSNLLRQTHKQQRKGLMICFSNLCTALKESHIGKNALFRDNSYIRLGVTDTGIVLKAKRVSCVLTVDLDLHNELLWKGYCSVNFNHLREKHLYSG